MSERTSLLKAVGHLEKMTATLVDHQVHYTLPLGESSVAFNELVGQQLRLTFSGQINCRHCGRATRKSFNQGYCYPCFRKLAACDLCIVSPERCHFDQGTCREPEWGLQHCMQPHVVYVANSSGLKVGITRRNQIPTRWIDQGAQAAMSLLEVSSRYLAGLVEVAAKAHVADRTDWRAMLKNQVPSLDLATEGPALLERIAPELVDLRARFGDEAIQAVEAEPQHFSYPVEQWPTKIKTHNPEREPVVEGQLWGIKGQYLILDSGVINIRKYAAYHVALEAFDAADSHHKEQSCETRNHELFT
ncbi:DUF2797 domain-containing protein [Mangrovitalea sediminis]|uniref:DUF2797 domain-containing protein n=1 Tax=Mangrovitalea sediminis TaxID=1982043 RepID=UPI000BE5ED55